MALQAVKSVLGVQVTTTKQLGTSMTHLHQIVNGLAASVKDHGIPASAFATHVRRGLRRTLEEFIGTVDVVENA